MLILIIGGPKSWFYKYGDQNFKNIKIGGSKVHLSQTSLMIEGGVLLNWTVKALWIRNSSIKGLAFNLELFPDKEYNWEYLKNATILFMT
jgi:hypothetical protein